MNYITVVNSDKQLKSMAVKQGNHQRERERKRERERSSHITTYLVSAVSPVACDLVNSDEIYSVLRSQDTFLACCLALCISI